MACKVVYFIASHVNPEQIMRLVRVCRTGSEQSRILIHHDYRVSNLDRGAVEAVGNVDLLDKQIPVEWGYFTMSRMLMHSMTWLLEHREFDWVVYLTGQDYPIKPLGEIEEFLARSAHDGYIECEPVEKVDWLIGAQRYLYRYYDVPKFPGWGRVRSLIQKNTARGRAAGRNPRVIVPQWPTRKFLVGWRPMSGPFDNGFRCYKGSCWWTLRRRSVEYMLRYLHEHPHLRNHYQRILFAPNESLFLSILRNNPDLKLVTDNNKRLIHWSDPESGHPDLLRAGDFEQLISSDRHFARKFDQNKDPRILDLLDEHVGACV